MSTADIFKYHIFMFRVCGIWPNEKGGWLYDCWSVIFYVIVAIGFPLSQLVCVFFVDSVDGVVENLLLVNTCATAAVKGVNLYIQKRKLVQLFSILDKLDENTPIERKKYEEIFEPLIKSGNRISLMFAAAYGTSWTILALQLFLVSADKRGWSSTYLYPEGFFHMPIIYVGGSIYQATSNLFFCFLDAALDTYAVIFMNILIGHIEVMKIQLQQFTADDSPQNRSRQYQSLIRLCEYYKSILRGSELLERIVSFAFLCQFGVSGVVLCTCAYQLSVLRLNEMSKIAFALQYSVCMIIEIYVPTYAGSMLRAETETLSHEIFKSNWLNKSHRYKISMMILVERTMRPIQITAGSLFELSLPTLLRILKAAYSLLALLKNV